MHSHLLPTQGSGLAAQAGVSVRGARRCFGPVVAVDHVDLDAPAGAVTALVGPDGAGKTTLLLMLATLIGPDAGEIRVAGHDPVRSPGHVRAAMGWMPDSLGSYETLTTREVLEFVAAANRLSRPARATRAAQLLDRVGLTEFADRPVHVLTHAQKQRLGLARALAHRPRVLLLDEPLAGLDAGGGTELRSLIRDLAADGAAVLVSAGSLPELGGCADHVVLVAAGRTARRPGTAAPETEAVPWRIRALDQRALLAALREREVGHAPQGDGALVLLRGDTEAADLVADLVGAGVRVTGLAPAERARNVPGELPRVLKATPGRRTRVN